MDEKELRQLEIVLTEKVAARLWPRILVVYAVSIVLALGLALSLVWQHGVVSSLSRERISEYRLLVADKLSELHQLDMEEVARRTRSAEICKTAMPQHEATALLAEEFDRPPEEGEITLFLETAARFGICRADAVRELYRDRERMAAVDTVYRVLLGRPADPVGRFIYGHWLRSGVEVEAVARDIMVSPEFQKLRKLGEP
jgi:hypothetical protein